MVDGVGQAAADVAVTVNRKFSQWRTNAQQKYDETNQTPPAPDSEATDSDTPDSDATDS